jgi:hypothetical protein
MPPSALPGWHGAGGDRPGVWSGVLLAGAVLWAASGIGCGGDSRPLDRPEVFQRPPQSIAQANSSDGTSTAAGGASTAPGGASSPVSLSGGTPGSSASASDPAAGASSGSTVSGSTSSAASSGTSGNATSGSTPASSTGGAGASGREPGSTGSGSASPPQGTGSGTPPAGEPPARAGLPAGLGTWTADDFRLARRRNDPRLPQAIRLHAERRADDPAAAALWIELLRLRPDVAPPAGTSPPNQPDDAPSAEGSQAGASGSAPPSENVAEPSGAEDNPASDAGTSSSPANAVDSGEVVRALIDALTVNRSPEAHGALRNMLAGSLTTELPAAQEVAFVADALRRSSDAQHTTLLVEALTRPQSFRSAAGPLTWAQLQQAALSAIGRRPSPALCRQIAEALPQPSSPEVAAVVQWLLEPAVDRLEAQWVLLVRGGLGAADERRARRTLAHYSAAALNQLLGIPLPQREQVSEGGPAVQPNAIQGDDPSGTAPDGPSAGGAPLVPLGALDAATLWWVGTHLWNSDPLLSALERDVRSWPNFARDDATLALVGATAHSRMRRAVREVIRNHWQHGPGTLLQSPGLLADPGLLPVVKSAPREPRLPLRGGSPAANPPAEPVPPDKPVSPAVARAMKEREARREWMDASERLMRLWMKRCAAVAGPPPEGRMDMPVRLFEDTVAVAYYRVALPEAAVALLGDPAAAEQVPWLVLHYARVEEKQLHSSESGRRFLHYQRQARTDTRCALPDGYWCEAVTPLRDRRHLLCVDVLFTTPATEVNSPDAAGQPPARQDWVTEILVIEIPDYVYE